MRAVRAATRSRCHARTFGHSRFISSADISAVRQPRNSAALPLFPQEFSSFARGTCFSWQSQSRYRGYATAASSFAQLTRDSLFPECERAICYPGWCREGGGRGEVRHISHKSARDITQRRRAVPTTCSSAPSFPKGPSAREKCFVCASRLLARFDNARSARNVCAQMFLAHSACRWVV